MDTVNPLANASFRRVFAAQVIALVGTGLSTIALTLPAYDLAEGSAAIVISTALAWKMVAYVFFAPIVGGLALLASVSLPAWRDHLASRRPPPPEVFD